jgi:hypothetical protein
MTYDYSISMEGVRTAERKFNEAARQIAKSGNDGPSVMASNDRVSISGAADLAGSLMAADQAKIAVEANLKVISSQDELEQSTLDVLA